MSTPGHLYLSCACLHGLHERCGQMQRQRGDFGQPHCKFCPAVCLCPVCGHAGGPVYTPHRAFYRALRDGDVQAPAWRARLHIVEEQGSQAGQQGLCTASARTHQQSRAVFFLMPAVPPVGVPWCGRCICRLIEVSGQLDLFAGLLSGRPAL